MSSTIGGTDMSWVGRWLDPPEVARRKRLLRAQPRSGDSRTRYYIGCSWALGLLALALAISIGVLIAMRQQASLQTPRPAVIRVIDDGARPGPKVLTTQVVPLP
jgi:hypothetical protein